MKSVLVSVVIPTHDRRAWVRESVESVLAQSFRDFELIVVDDGSSDGTGSALVREFGDRIRLLSTSNRGVAAARNAGAAAASGNWLAFLDSDDLWLPHKLSAQLAYFEANFESSVCQTEEIWIRNGRRVNPCRRHSKPEGDIFTASLERCLVTPSAVMMRRDLFERLGGFDESLPVCEDYDLWLRLSLANRVGLVRQPLVVKRGGHADQLSRRYWGMDRFRVAALAKILTQPLSPPQRAAVLDVLERKCAILAAGAEKRGLATDAGRYRVLATTLGSADA